MPRVRLLHWNAEEASATCNLLTAAGFQVDYDQAFDSSNMRACRQNPPNAVVISLARLPSRGREVAIAFRQSPKTRTIPILFCDGLPEKVKLICEVLPDATYCTQNELVKCLKLAKLLQAPLQPADMMNRYQHRTVAQKLGIVEESHVAVLNPPRDLTEILGELPRGVDLVESVGEVTLCFLHSPDDLRAAITGLRHHGQKTKLWFAWRKKSARSHDGVTDQLVRQTGIDLGLVDYKVCSLDQTWTAMLFAKQKRT